MAPSAWGYLSGPLRQLTRACGPRPTSHASSWQLFQRPTTRRMMTYALLSMSERHGILAGIMCAGASPVPTCAELIQPPAWFFAAVARPCLWAVGVQLPPHLAASASCCVTRRSCCGGSLRRRRPACRGSLASELLSRRGPCRRPRPEKHDGRRHDSQDGVVLPNCRVPTAPSLCGATPAPPRDAQQHVSGPAPRTRPPA